MYCENCGNKLKSGASFCNKCGAPVKLEQADKKQPVSDSFLSDIVRAKSLNRLYFGLVLVAVSFVIFFFERNYISNILSGPRQKTPDQIEQELVTGNPQDININLQLNSGEVFQSGYTHITQSVNSSTNEVESETTDAEYYLTIVGKHLLVLEGKVNQKPSTNFEGAVIPIPQDLESSISAEFSKDPELAGLEKAILPYALSDKGIFSLDNVYVLVFGIGLFVWGCYIVFRRLADIEDKGHFAFRISDELSYKNIGELSEDFVKNKESGVVDIGRYEVSSKYIFKEDYFSFSIYPLSRMYWAYKRETTHRVNFVPTGKSYGLVLNFMMKNGTNITIEAKEPEDKVNEHLYLFARLCPWAKIGYK